MSTLMLPFNISITHVTNERVSTLRPVKSLDIFDGATANFHEDGLFSVSTFGRVGDERRDRQFGYVQLKVTVFHPIIYNALCALKALYRGILNSTDYAVWDDEIKDFVASDELLGQTGYSFFVKHWLNIEYRETKSGIRQTRIELVKKYGKVALTDKILVLPAGLRDIEASDDGRKQQDPINDFYRRIISINNVISDTYYNDSEKSLDQSRRGIQRSFNDVYDTLQKMISGKRGFIQDKWASRKVFSGTRNVISAMDASSSDLKSPRSIKLTDTIVGLYQHAKAIEPVTKHLLSNGYLSRVFGVESGKALLTDPKTLKSGYITVNTDEFDRWNTEEGLSKVLNSFSDPSMRHKPVKIAGHYLGLIYLGDDMSFRMFSDIDDLPEGLDRSSVSPITLCQLIYLSGYREWNRYPALITRYPVTGLGSIYPSTVYVKTTIKSEVRKELGENWEPLGDDYVAYEFPISAHPAFIDTMSPHLSRLAALGADFDGDTCSYTALYTEDSIAEITELLKNKAAFLRSSGGFRTSTTTDTVSLVLHNMTSR
jgi:hypothetical protein